LICDHAPENSMR